MSSHREAPEISKDPVADNTDVYAFVSPDKPDTVTIIANYIPLQPPAGGPNFYEFGEDVLYEINISNGGTAQADISYQFRFTTEVRSGATFLYNTGPITSLESPNWNRRQVYSVTKVSAKGAQGLGSGLPCPPCNIGPDSTPNYASLADAAIQTLATGETVFAGQRADGFFVDLGAVFDLLNLRPLQNLHIDPAPAAAAVNGVQGFNVYTIALQVPKASLTKDGSSPTSVMSATSVIGVWATASRQKARVYDSSNGQTLNTGPFVQVSRLGNPLVNEVVNPLSVKDLWNSLPPSSDSQFATYVENPEVAALLPILYPGVFPHLAGLKAPRKDLAAILLTGIPAGIVPGFQNNTGSTPADMLRLNMAVPPTANPNPIGLIAGDAAGFPNGRRLADDVVAIELRAIAGATYPLIDKSYTPDAAASKVTDGTTNTNGAYLSAFPYLALPISGFAFLPGCGAEVASSTTPSGAPQTGGGGTAGGTTTAELLTGGGVALAGAAAAVAALAHRSKPVLVPAAESPSEPA